MNHRGCSGARLNRLAGSVLALVGGDGERGCRMLSDERRVEAEPQRVVAGGGRRRERVGMIGGYR